MCMKRTNILLDETLISEGLEITGLKTQKALVHHALTGLVRRGRQRKILQLAGKHKWVGNLNQMREMR